MEGNNNEVIVESKTKKEETKAMIQAISAVVAIAIAFIYFMYFYDKPNTEENTTNETNTTEINETVEPIENTTETNTTETNETEENTTEENSTIEMKEFKFDFESPCLEDINEKVGDNKKYSVIIDNLKIVSDPIQFIYDFDEAKSSTTVFINNKAVTQRTEKERIDKVCVYKNNLIISYIKDDGFANDIIGYNNKLKTNFDGLYTIDELTSVITIKYASYANDKDRTVYYYEDEMNLSTLDRKIVKKDEVKCGKFENNSIDDSSNESITETDKNTVITKVCLSNK